MRKVISILIICILLSAGGYPAGAELEDGVTIIDENYNLFYNKYRDDDDGPLFLARYRNDSCTVEELHLSINEYMNFSDGNGIEKGSGKNGVFVIEDGWLNARANAIIIDTATEKAGVTRLYYIDPERQRYEFEYPEGTRLLVNGVTAVRMGNRTLNLFYRDGTPFKLDFDYGKMIYIKNYNWYNAQYYPINIEYSVEREQYVVIYTRSPYSNTKEGNVKKDTTKCAVSVAVFDKNGEQVKKFPLDGLYYRDGLPRLYVDTYLDFSDTPVYFPQAEPNAMYINGLIKEEYIKKSYAPFDFAPIDSESSDPDEIERSKVKVDLDNETYEFISLKQFYKHIKKPSYPFIIEKRENETRLISKTTGETLATLKGDYTPIDYSDNTDGSFEMIFGARKHY